jgi:hypothetical protein
LLKAFQIQAIFVNSARDSSINKSTSPLYTRAVGISAAMNAGRNASILKEGSPAATNVRKLLCKNHKVSPSYALMF